jgi:hypothetical protein
MCFVLHVPWASGSVDPRAYLIGTESCGCEFNGSGSL